MESIVSMLYEEFLPEIKDTNAYIQYIQLITNSAIVITNDCYVERHHIVPKSFLPKELHNDGRNIVTLSPYNHLLAHKLLSIATKNRLMNYAYWCMIQEYKRRNENSTVDFIDENEYDRIRSIVAEEASVYQKGKKFTEEHKKNLSIAHSGFVMPEETKIKISRGNKGKVKNETWRKNLSTSCSGRIGTGLGKVFIHLGDEKEMRVYPEEVNDYTTQGWTLGRKKINSRPGITRDSVWITKDCSNKVIDKSQLDVWLSLGWRIGKYRRRNIEIQQEKDARALLIQKTRSSKAKRWDDIQ